MEIVIDARRRACWRVLGIPARRLRHPPCGLAEVDRLSAVGLTTETDPPVAVDSPRLTIFFQ